MHTSDEPGIDADLAKDLENPITWIPPLDGADEEDVVEKACQDLEKTLNDEVPALTSESSVRGELVNFAELDRLERGDSTAVDEENINVVGNEAASAWDIEELMNR
jgi:hypothetical protein